MSGASGPIIVKVFVGQQPDGASREWAGLNHFWRLTPNQVPEPLLFDEQRQVVAMSHLAGDTLADQVLTSEQVHALAAWVLATADRPPNEALPLARTAPSLLVPRTHRWWSAMPAQPVEDEVVTAAVLAADSWLRSSEFQSLLRLPTDSVTRGDTNLANCLSSETGLAFVDFEDCGWNHRAVSLGELIEHIRASSNPESTWELLMNLVQLSASDRRIVLTVRRRFAIIWLLQLLPGGRAADRNPAEALQHQAHRVLSLLNTTGSGSHP